MIERKGIEIKHASVWDMEWYAARKESLLYGFSHLQINADGSVRHVPVNELLVNEKELRKRIEDGRSLGEMLKDEQ